MSWWLYNLKGEDDQLSEPPIRGLLASEIHLNNNSQDSEIEIQLTGSKT
ncbi:hypothetical protein ACU6U9_17180 [Pseudomonas sp. HK3]